jgi:hypothetical protein
MVDRPALDARSRSTRCAWAQEWRGWGSAGVRREFDGEDWSQFNRLSLWIYPDCPGFNVVSLELRLYNEGLQRLPGSFGWEGETTVVLQKPQRNHVVWELGNLSRDKVTRII